MLAAITGRVGGFTAMLTISVSLLAGAYWLGGREARREADALRARIDTMERMDDAERGIRGLDDGAVLDWLHRRGR